MLYKTFTRTSHRVNEAFWNGKGAVCVGCESGIVFIVRNDFLYTSRRNSLLRNQFGTSVNMQPIIDGSLSSACRMHNAKEWHVHLSCMREGDAFLSLDQWSPNYAR